MSAWSVQKKAWCICCLLGLFFFLAEGSLAEEKILPSMIGRLSDISFEPSYIWLTVDGDETQRVRWVYKKTSFLTGEGAALSFRDFLEKYKGWHVEILLEGQHALEVRHLPE